MYLVVETMNLKQLREKAGLSPEAMSATLEVAYSSLMNWESGKTEPTMGVTKIPQVLAAYQCSLDEFLEAVKETRANPRKAFKTGGNQE
jgi:transcriptional regulator with XRE-family HTH domain